MSSYMYTALGHSLRCPDGTMIVCRLTQHGWVLIENGFSYSPSVWFPFVRSLEERMLSEVC